MSWDTSPKTGLFYVLLTSKGGNIAFLSHPLCAMCCALVLAAYRKQQTLQLWMKGTGEGCRFFCSPKLPYLRTMSQQFCRRLKDHILYRFLETLQTGYSPFLNSKCCLCTCFIELLSIFLVPNYLPFNDFVGGCSFFMSSSKKWKSSPLFLWDSSAFRARVGLYF